MRKKVKKTGFTLIEMLIVVGVLGIIAIIGTGTFFTLLKSSAKTKVLAEVKQNGSYALGVMERMIRNARSIVINSDTQICETGMLKIKIENPDGAETEFACEADKISSNSASLTSDKVVPSGCSFDCEAGEAGVKPDKVTIDFSLSQAGTDVRVEEEAMLDFHTTVILRNY